MKRFKIYLLLAWLVLVVAMFLGCTAYLPPDMMVALDQRIGELETDVEEATGDCKTMLQQDLAVIQDIKAACEGGKNEY